MEERKKWEVPKVWSVKIIPSQQPICLSSVKLFLIKNIFRRHTIFFAADFVGGGKLRKTLFGASFVHFFRIQKKLYCPFVSLAAAAATAARSVGSPI